MTELNNKIIKKNTLNSIHGFTLIELVLVIVILGIMAVGISGFITLSTQTYVNATTRDEVVSNARFVIERLTRELRNAVPNSIRVAESSDNKAQCIEFVPIVASTVYLDIPVIPEAASKEISVVDFVNDDNSAYECDSDDSCTDLVIAYPLNETDVYNAHDDATGKVFSIDKLDKSVDPWIIYLLNDDDVNFSEDSPTQRLYIANEQVKYCVSTTRIYRYSNTIGESFSVPGTGNSSLMAEYITSNISSALPFNYIEGTLTRNAVVQIHLDFNRYDENYVFDHEVHIINVP